jgi:hypothetical protein
LPSCRRKDDGLEFKIRFIEAVLVVLTPLHAGLGWIFSPEVFRNFDIGSALVGALD